MLPERVELWIPVVESVQAHDDFGARESKFDHFTNEAGYWFAVYSTFVPVAVEASDADSIGIIPRGYWDEENRKPTEFYFDVVLARVNALTEALEKEIDEGIDEARDAAEDVANKVVDSGRQAFEYIENAIGNVLNAGARIGGRAVGTGLGAAAEAGAIGFASGLSRLVERYPLVTASGAIILVIWIRSK